jgi:hypothetical protein
VEIIGEDDEPLLEKLWDIGLAFDQVRRGGGQWNSPSGR